MRLGVLALAAVAGDLVEVDAAAARGGPAACREAGDQGFVWHS